MRVMEVMLENLRSHTVVRRACAALCLFCFTALLPLSPKADDAPREAPSNYEVVERLSGDALAELISNMPQVPRGSILYLEKQKGIGEIDFVLENEMLVSFREAGYRIVKQKTEAPAVEEGSVSYRLSYQIIRLSLGYPKISRRFWIGPKRVEREAQIDLFAQLADARSGEIIWVGDTQKRYEDDIDYSMLEKVEDPEYDFTRPERDELKMSRLIEPLVVGGVVIGLVLLFFSNQSND